MTAGLGCTPRIAPLACLRLGGHPPLCGGRAWEASRGASAARSTRWAGPAACWASPSPHPPHGCVKGQRREARRNHRQQRQARASSSGSTHVPAAPWRRGRPNPTLSVNICALSFATCNAVAAPPLSKRHAGTAANKAHWRLWAFSRKSPFPGTYVWPAPGCPAVWGVNHPCTTGGGAPWCRID